MSDWREILLEDVAEEITVGYVGPMASEYVPRGVPFLRSQNVEPLRINPEDMKFVTPDFHDRLAKSALSPGDVVIVRTGKPGACAVMPDWLPVSNCSDLVIVRCGDRLDARFLAYYVNTVAAPHVSAHLVGAVQQHFNVGSARKMKMNLPQISEQRAIASVLGALDDKIELNRRTNETLEALAQGLFQEWLVAPPREGLPKGWREESLDGVAHFLNGLALQRFPPEGEDSLPVIKIAQLRAGSTEGADRTSATIPSDYIVQDGDVLFSWSGSLEVELWCGGRGALNQHLFKVTSQEFPKWFYFLWTRHHLADFQAIAAGKATTMGHIQRHHLTEAKVLIAPAQKLKVMDSTMSPLIERIIANCLESRTLAALRDTLLPKLLSGEIRIEGVENSG